MADEAAGSDASSRKGIKEARVLDETILNNNIKFA
jgi:hypothetical protein